MAFAFEGEGLSFPQTYVAEHKNALVRRTYPAFANQ
jgi:hypothetical protein